jgi:hypothetical protein
MQPHDRMARKIAKALAKNPDLAFQFYCMASEIVDDFEDYGPTLQADEKGEYTEVTVIKRLQRVRKELMGLIDNG